MMRVLIITLLVCGFSGLNLYGQTLNIKKLDSLFSMLESRRLAMGSVAIMIDGKLQYQRAVGFASLGESYIRSTTQTKYRIGSVSKMFTAVMIFQLIEEGRISLNQKLDSYFPDLPNVNKITIENLLYHRSGLHSYTDDDTHFQEWMDKPKTHDELLAIIGKKIDFEPNAKAEYCNTNYLLLSYIIEKVCQTTYADELAKRIIAKIDLPNTYYGGPVALDKHESYSYKFDNGNWKQQKETAMNIHSGAGSIVSNPVDLVKFINALFMGKLVSKASLSKMKTMVDDYGMGMFPYDFGMNTGYGHNGRIEEFYSAVRYFPAKRLALAYCTNGILYPRTDILEGILSICFNKPYTIPFSKSIKDTSQDFNKYLGLYASSQLPIIVTCKTENNKLVMETKGQSFVVEPINPNYFMYAPTGTFFEFYPEKGELKIKETDNVYNLNRQK